MRLLGRLHINGAEFSRTGNYPIDKLESINGADGRTVFDYSGPNGDIFEGKRAEYYHTDHLGNTRLAFSDFDLNGVIVAVDLPGTPEDDTEITLEKHYYPFGMEQIGPWYGSVEPPSNYRYNGKELDESTGLYDYGARFYDPAIARWTSIDPLADQYAAWSPYNYVMGNPIKFIDPDGMQVDNTIFVDEDGQELYRTEDGLDDAIVVVNNDNRDRFLAMSDAVQNANEVDESDIQWLRSAGDSYFTNALDELWEKGASIRHPAGYNFIESTIGDGGWTPEVSVDAKRNSNGEVIPDWSTFQDHKDPLGNMNYYTEGTSYWHSHPEGNHYYKYRQDNGTFKRKRGVHADGGPPSAADYNQISRKKMNGLYNVAVLKSGYYFFNNKGNEFFIPRSSF